MGLVNLVISLGFGETDEFDTEYNHAVAILGSLIGFIAAIYFTIESGGGLAVIFLAPAGLLVGSIIGAIIGFFTSLAWFMAVEALPIIITAIILMGIVGLGYLTWGLGSG